MASKTRSQGENNSDKESQADSDERQRIDPAMFDGLMRFAAKAGNQTEADEPDLEYPPPEEGPRVNDDK